ncbi:uncharacterized protein LOC128209629 [Mya arenaria]|uniref:uncharacterized protein LOC128209629 n=1 Tax=Mya arenaria TaxID=6604 RepID=UPI0022E5D199|nr:uncharacterized protein LOC128209629 [Mya arenaria]
MDLGKTSINMATVKCIGTLIITLTIFVEVYAANTNGTAPLAKEVIVVGGGIAGMAAARRLLQDKSYTVRVFEARKDRYGGRIWTDRSLGKTLKGVDVEMGAMFLNTRAKNNPLIGLAKKFELNTVNSGSVQIRYYNDKVGLKLFSGENATGLLAEAFGIMSKAIKNAKSSSDSSVIQVTTKELQSWMENNADVKDKQGFDRNLLGPILNSFPAMTVHNFSSKLYDMNIDLGWDSILVDGVGALLDRIVSGSSGTELPVKVELGKVLRNIKVDNKKKKVLVRTADRKQVSADAVVFALPLGVLKTDEVWFEPRLPENKYQAIRDIGLGYSGKIIIGFDEPFWPKDVGSFIACSETARNGFLQSWFNAYRISGNPILHGNIFGDQARTWEIKSENELKKMVLKILGEMFGSDVVNARKITVFQYSSWSSDEYIQGSISYPKVGNSKNMWKTLQEPVCPYIFFAGVYTEDDSHIDSLHGAYNSGIRAAEQILGNYCNVKPSSGTNAGQKAKRKLAPGKEEL